MKKTPVTISNKSPFLDVLEAANYLGIARSTLDTYRSEGRGPAYRKHGWRVKYKRCLLYTSPSPRDRTRSRMPSSA